MVSNASLTQCGRGQMRKMSFDELVADWSQDDLALFKEIFPKFYKVTSCQMALFMPGHSCRDVSLQAIMTRAKESQDG